MIDRRASVGFTPEELAWPLVGREEELGCIAAARDAEDGRGVVLTASAGIGKSRLARQAMAVAEQEGAYVSWVQATRSAATVPLGACAGLLPADVRADDPLELMRRCADALRERAGSRRIVLGVDDAQLLDPTSAALVLHLTVTGSAFVLATLRTGEPCPDAVQSLWKDAGATRVTLRALTESETTTLIETVLGGHVEQRAGRWVFDSSRGNALYVRELIVGALAEGALEETHGFWRLVHRPPPSQSLSELITARMSHLAEPERRAVELLALGEPLRLSEMVELAGTEAVAEVESQALVTVEGPEADAAVRLAHPLYGEVIAASMAVVRASQARSRLAQTVQARADRSPDAALRIARWLLDAGEPIPVALLVEAAAAAIRAGDPELGARLARLALDADAGAEAAILLARALSVRMRHDEAEAVLADLEGSIENRHAAREYLQQRTLGLIWGLMRPDDALALLDRAQAWWPDHAWRHTLDVLRLHPLAIRSGFTQAVLASEAVLADPDLDPASLRRTELVHATNLFYSGRVREARELVLRRRPPVPLRDEIDEIALVLWCVVGLESGWDFEAAEQWMSGALRDAVRANDHTAAGIAAATLGTLHLLGARYVDAARWLTESVVHLERHDPFQTLKAVRGSLVGVAYYTGDHEGAAAAMERCREAIGDREMIDTDRAYVIRAEAWAVLAEGDRPRAQRLLLDAAAELTGVPLYAAHLYHEALRAGAAPQPLIEPIAELGRRCDARLVAAYVDHVAARAAGDGTALLRCTEEFAGIGTIRYATECAAAAAESFAAAGREDSARRAAARSRELHELGQGGFPPEIRGVDSAAVMLTPRETQLVELAARGLSNAEIADRLVLSVRTVESHVYRAMQKLGVSDRRDL